MRKYILLLFLLYTGSLVYSQEMPVIQIESKNYKGTKAQYDFDSKGHLLSIIIIGADTLINTQVKYLDTRPVSIHSAFKMTNDLYHYNFIYNKKGKIISKSADVNGETAIFKYDSEKLVSVKNLLDPINSYYYNMTYKYDKKGRIAEILKDPKNPDNDYQKEIVSISYKGDRIIKTITSSCSGTVTEIIKNGKLTAVETNNCDKNNINYSYYKNGLLKSNEYNMEISYINIIKGEKLLNKNVIRNINNMLLGKLEREFGYNVDLVLP